MPSDVVALKETAAISHPGYIAFQQFFDLPNQEASSTGTLARKSLWAKQHDLEFPDIPPTVMEILPRKHSHQSVLVLNIYCVPWPRADDFNLLFLKNHITILRRTTAYFGRFQRQYKQFCALR
ncbi:hypothetical protein MRX96_045986 [Rhipicephalus microplus]